MKRIIKIVLSVLMIVTIMAIYKPTETHAANRTTPANVTVEQARERIYKLKDALEYTYFTTTGKTCHTPWEENHPPKKPYHEDCNVKFVLKKNKSIGQKLGILRKVSEMSLNEEAFERVPPFKGHNENLREITSAMITSTASVKSNRLRIYQYAL